MNYTVANPVLLFLLPLALIPLLPRRQTALAISSLLPLVNLGSSWRIRAQRLRPLCAALSLALLIIALAGPVERQRERRTVRQGVDLMLALDVSASQAARDILPDRMTAARNAAADFLETRRDDRVGVILFSGTPLLLSPPVLDKGQVAARLRAVRADSSGTGTAIGDALAAALARLKESPAQSKAVILLTDGSSNRGRVTPRAAGRAAAALGVRIYAIGFGTDEGSDIPIGPDGKIGQLGDGTALRGALEEEPLRELARLTGGRYFRADSGTALQEVYHQIDQLEKSPLEIREIHHDRALTPLLLKLVAGLLIAELLIYRFWLRSLP